MTEVVQCVDVTRKFGDLAAVRNVDLSVCRGEIVALLGPNGAGKSTLLDMLVGLRAPTSGRVRLCGSRPTARIARARVGVMLQDTSGAAGLTVTETILLVRRLYPRSWPVERLLATAELGDKRKARVMELSGGERQRLSLALALAGDPDVLILDEPTAALDVAARRRLWSTLRELAADGRTVLLATHHLLEAEELAQRVVIMHRGEKVADGPTASVVEGLAVRRTRLVTDAPAAWLRRQPGVRSVECVLPDAAGGRAGFVILAEEPERLLHNLFRHGYRVDHLTVAAADLESAFLALTERRVAA